MVVGGKSYLSNKERQTHSIVILGHISKLVSLKKKIRVKKVWIKKGEGAGGRGGTSARTSGASPQGTRILPSSSSSSFFTLPEPVFYLAALSK